MPIQAGSGISGHDDHYHAGFEAVKKAMEAGGIVKPDIVFAFASVKFDQAKMLAGMSEAAGGAPIVGCSAAGEITNDGPNDKMVAALAVRSPDTQYALGIGRDVKNGAREAGRMAAEDVKKNAPSPLKAFIMFPDVLTGNGADAVRGALEVLGEHFPLVGGAAGDDFLFKETFQYKGAEAVTGSVVAVGLSGSCAIGIGVGHGWIPIGLPMKVTRSEGSVLYELDGKPAISLYEDYFGNRAEDLRSEPLARMAVTHPIGIKTADIDEFLIRDPITVGDDGSITCAAEVPVGSEVRLMIGTKEKAVSAAEEAARKLMDDFRRSGAAPKFMLIFNCIAREKLFGQEAKDEINAVQNIVGRGLPIAGFYTYGEQAPFGGEIRDTSKIHARFYNETIVLFAVGE
ncbi:FIST C-terminal domain-containing protein [bacterium]|nr:FIST C-terminal domain-containing protein [bacterium]